jgi:hypothetical protein
MSNTALEEKFAAEKQQNLSLAHEKFAALGGPEFLKRVNGKGMKTKFEGNLCITVDKRTLKSFTVSVQGGRVVVDYNRRMDDKFGGCFYTRQFPTMEAAKADILQTLDAA